MNVLFIQLLAFFVVIYYSIVVCKCCNKIFCEVRKGMRSIKGLRHFPHRAARQNIKGMLRIFSISLMGEAVFLPEISVMYSRPRRCRTYL